ncbi:MAG: protein translocase subunit SecF, partial [Burkholderiaceae bacterium]
MEFFRLERTIPFMRHAVVLNVISFSLFIAAIAAIALRGLAFSIEFTGGTVVEVSYSQTA